MAGKFEMSQAPGGLHHSLARMAGEWSGTTQVWFQPGDPVDTSEQSGTIRVVGGGRFLLHEYRGSFQGAAQDGVALCAVHLDAQNFETAWVDSFHTGTAIMSSSGPIEAGFSALTSYTYGQGGPPWGWRTTFEQPSDDELLITMMNITPKGEECKAVETRYSRKT